MLKKGLVYAIIVLFVGMSIVPIAGSLSAEKYVSTDKHITAAPEVEVTWETYNVDGKWYVTFTCDSSEGMSGIEKVEFFINDGLCKTLSGPGPDWTVTIEWTEEIKSSTFKFVFYDLEGNTAVVIIDGSDVAPLGADVTWEVHKVDGTWYVTFTCDSSEGMNDIDRVEIYIDDVIHKTIEGPGPDWTFTIEWTKEIKSSIFKFVFYDLEGNSVAVIIKGSDIKSQSSIQQSTVPLFFQILQRLMNLR